MRAIVESRPSRVTTTSSAPRPLIVPANTSAPGVFSTGSDSPVTGAWLTWLSPAPTRPSIGIFSPGRTTTMSPTRTASTGRRSSTAPRRTSASAGARFISARIAPRARSIARVSSSCASANRKTTDAPSDHSPSAMAPATATSMSTLMSRTRARSDTSARRPVWMPPKAMAAANGTQASGATAGTNRARNPATIARPDAQTRMARKPPAVVAMRGSSCSSQARIPVRATASAMCDVVSTAASCLTRSRWLTTSASSASSPASRVSVRSRMATSS